MKSKTKLTKSFVQNLEPKAKEYHVWDRDLPGFGVRVHPSGRKTFVGQTRDHRDRTRKDSFGTFGTWTVEQARTDAKQWLHDVQAGVAAKSEHKAILFERLVEEWLAGPALRHRRTHARRKPDAIKNDERNLKIHAMPLLRGKYADEITRADIEAVRDRAEKKTPHPGGRKRKGRGFRGDLGGLHAASRSIRTLKSVFAYAEDRTYLTRNPAKGVRTAPDQKRAVFLTSAELHAVRLVLDEARAKGVNPKSLDVIKLWLLVGGRRKEIEALRWDDVDLDRRILRLSQTKTGPKEKYLPPLAVEIIARQNRKLGNPYVFPGDVSHVTYHQNAKNVWAKLRKEHWPRVRPHDFRHTFASQLAEKGVGLHEIKELLGHTSIRSTERYAHLTQERLHAAVALVEGPFK
ncbi:MAG: site-specific integrase [Proteobacteria bacterium]|nr:site-specific integrase [Pseudomonadota bacterium]